jgi:hypothetical protein
MNVAEIIDAARLPVLYLVCPVSAPDRAGVLENLSCAERWYRWLITEMHVSVSAPWLTSCRVLDELNPEHRRIGMRANYAQLGKADALFLAGGRISGGMQGEWDFFSFLPRVRHANPQHPRILDYSYHREPTDLAANADLAFAIEQIRNIAQHLRAPS